jgi:bacitracin transport system permease protein
MMLVEALQSHFEHPEKVFTLSNIYDSSLLYVMLLMNMMVYVAITAYLFSREYAEKTLKMILPSPVSRIDFIIGKFLKR